MPERSVRNLVTGGAGFLGSHLVDHLMQAGEEVICLDNYFTGRNKYYGPQDSWLQERPPYQGSVADFYEQVMRDLIERGY